MAIPLHLLRYTHETPHFVFRYTYASDTAARTDRHYDSSTPTSARHGVRNFAYIENYAIYFEAAWRHYFDSLVRYRIPPGVDAAHKYRIYVYDIGQVYGITFPDQLLPDGRTTSYIAVRNNYQGFGVNDDPDPEQGSMKVTAAHEFFHAVQFGYPLGDDWDWWMEASATFMEDEIFDAVNDYNNYLPDWFGMPELPLDHFNGGHQYGSVILCKYLAEKVGGAATIEAILRKAKRPSALQAIDGVLKKDERRLASSRRPEVFSTGFTISNLLKDHSRFGYEEGRRYPALRVGETSSSYPVSTRTVSVDHLATTYLRFLPLAQARTLHLAFGVEKSRRAELPVRIAAIIQDPEMNVGRHEVSLRLNQGGFFGGVEIPSFGRTSQAREVVAVIANTTWGAQAKDGVAISYAAALG